MTSPLTNSSTATPAASPAATDTTSKALLQEALHAVAIGISAARGEAIFDEVAKHVAAALHADLALVSRLIPPGQGSARSTWELETLAVRSHDGQVIANFRYPLSATPCNEVLGRQFHQVSGDLRQRYPDDPILESKQLDYYAGYPLFSSTGEALGLIAVVSSKALPERLVTESLLSIFAVRTAAELERLQAEASYRAIFNASEDAIFIHDLDSGVILDANPKACETYGYTHAELLGMDVGQLSAGFPPYTLTDAAQWIGLARAGKPQRFQWQRRNRDGSLHWDEVLLRRATIGGIDRILAMTRDISDHKATLDALSRSEQQYRAMVSTALDCIISMDGTGLVTGFNPAAEQCFGFRQQDVLGKQLADLIIPLRFREAHRRGMAHYLDKGRGPFLGRRVEVRAQRANGEEFPAELAITSVAHEGGLLFIGYLRDITERQRAEAERARLEQQLRQAQRMEAIGQLTGGIAHDFNNLLTSILGYTGMSQSRAAALPDTKLSGYLQQIRRAGERARDLIAQMLTFSRGGRGQPEPTNVAHVLTEFLPLIKATLPGGIDLQIQAPADLPTTMVDPLQLEQVVMNLCVNARDALGDSGTMVVGIEAVQLGKTACASCLQDFSGQHLALSVRDSGPGIPGEIRTHMFEPFYSSKPQGKGSGMGLAIVHGIVHEWGGHLSVSSGMGQGSCFTAYVPCSASALPPAYAAATSQPAPESKLQGRILLVDDEPLVADFMTELLQEWGLQATVFNDPLAAQETLLGSIGLWDLVILDQTMPELSGLDLASRALRQRPNLKVVLYTGYSESLDENAVQALGIKAVLRKPLDESQLHALLTTLLQQS